MIVQWFSDPEELARIVGGERWWQVRGLDGVEAEWVTENSFLKDVGAAERMKKKGEELGRSLTDAETDIIKMNELERVMVSSLVHFDHR